MDSLDLTPNQDAIVTTRTITLPETNIFAPENGWLEDDPFFLGGPFSRAMLNFRDGIFLGSGIPTKKPSFVT